MLIHLRTTCGGYTARADAAEEFRVEEEVRQGLRLAERAAKKCARHRFTLNHVP
jgi:hypothetical protein